MIGKLVGEYLRLFSRIWWPFLYSILRALFLLNFLRLSNWWWTYFLFSIFLSRELLPSLFTRLDSLWLSFQNYVFRAEEKFSIQGLQYFLQFCRKSCRTEVSTSRQQSVIKTEHNLLYERRVNFLWNIEISFFTCFIQDCDISQSVIMFFVSLICEMLV